MDKDDDPRNRRVSILKPNKPRTDGNVTIGLETPGKPMGRRVSFANSNYIKPFAADPEKNTVWDTTYEEPVNNTDSTQSQSTKSIDALNMTTFAENLSGNGDVLDELVIPPTCVESISIYHEETMEQIQTKMLELSKSTCLVAEKENIVPLLRSVDKEKSILSFVQTSSEKKLRRVDVVKQSVDFLGEQNAYKVINEDSSRNVITNQTTTLLQENIPHISSCQEMEFTCQLDKSNIDRTTVESQNSTLFEMELTCQHSPTGETNIIENNFTQIYGEEKENCAASMEITCRSIKDFDFNKENIFQEPVNLEETCKNNITDMDFTCQHPQLQEHLAEDNDSVVENGAVNIKNNSIFVGNQSNSCTTMRQVKPVIFEHSLNIDKENPPNIVSSGLIACNPEFTGQISIFNNTIDGGGNSEMKVLNKNSSNLNTSEEKVKPKEIDVYCDKENFKNVSLSKTDIHMTGLDMEFTCQIPHSQKVFEEIDKENKLLANKCSPLDVSDDKIITNETGFDMELTCQIPQHKQIVKEDSPKNQLEIRQCSETIIDDNTCNMEFTCQIPQKIILHVNSENKRSTQDNSINTSSSRLQFIENEEKTDPDKENLFIERYDQETCHDVNGSNMDLSCQTSEVKRSLDGNDKENPSHTTNVSQIDKTTCVNKVDTLEYTRALSQEQNTFYECSMDVDESLDYNSTKNLLRPHLDQNDQLEDISHLNDRTRNDLPLNLADPSEVLNNCNLTSSQKFPISSKTETETCIQQNSNESKDSILHLSNLPLDASNTINLINYTISSKPDEKINNQKAVVHYSEPMQQITPISSFHLNFSNINDTIESTHLINAYIPKVRDDISLPNQELTIDHQPIFLNTTEFPKGFDEPPDCLSIIIPDTLVNITSEEQNFSDFVMEESDINITQLDELLDWQINDATIKMPDFESEKQLVQELAVCLKKFKKSLKGFHIPDCKEFAPIETPEPELIKPLETTVEILPEVKTVRQKVVELAQINNNYWNLENVKDDSCVFSTLFGRVRFTVQFCSESGIVSGFVVTTQAEGLDAFSKYLTTVFEQRVASEHLQQVLCAAKYDILTLLDYISLVVEDVVKINNEFDELRKKYWNLDFKMDSEFCIRFNLLSIKAIIDWEISVQISTKKFTVISSEDITATHGMDSLLVNEERLKSLANGISKDLKFVRRFIEATIKYYYSVLGDIKPDS